MFVQKLSSLKPHSAAPLHQIYFQTVPFKKAGLSAGLRIDAASMALLLATAGDIAPKVLGLLLTTVGQGLFHQGPRIVRNLYKRIPHPALTDACFPSETATQPPTLLGLSLPE